MIDVRRRSCQNDAMKAAEPDTTRLYVDCMEGIRRRVTYVKWLMNDKPLGDDDSPWCFFPALCVLNTKKAFGFT